MNRTQPPWLNKELYPFQSRWIDIDGHTLHYIDEGSGDTILFAHGTPEWSFGFREVIKALRGSFRCIAIDMLGFGLSDKPAAADYTCQAHASRLEKFIGQLGLKNISLMANDFGGGIGMSYAISNPDNINLIMLFNTWMWSLANDKHYTGPAKLMNSWLGRMLYLRFNFPVTVIMPAAYGNKKLLTRDVHDHYKHALKKGERTAAYTFSKELIDASPWWQQHWEQLDILQHKRFLFFWGMKDNFIPPAALEKWKSRLPQARVVVFDDAGHFVQEEKPLEISRTVKDFMDL